MMRSTFAIPAILAMLSVLGLLSALTGDGARDVVSWLSLGSPVAAVVVAMCLRAR